MGSAERRHGMATLWHPGTSLSGRLLVASRHLRDPNFFRTVVLMLEHGEGALGIVLNRASHVSIAKAAPQWGGLAGEPALVFRGGPVEPTAAIALGRPGSAAIATEGDPRFTPLFDDLGVVDLGGGPEDLEGVVRDLRIFSGYSGWSAEQLEAEIEAGGWTVTEAEGLDLLTRDPASLWTAAERRAGMETGVRTGASPSVEKN